MLEVQIDLPLHFRPESISEMVERACAAESLTCSMKGTLTSFPNCVHWHWKRGKERGTLEITWWGKQDRLWFKVAAGRTGSWIEGTLIRLKQHIEYDFQSEAEPPKEAQSEFPLPARESRLITEATGK